jgi:hypothetical protein
MQHSLTPHESQFIPGQPVGYASNDGIARYMLEVESTTGFVAFKLADGTTLVSEAKEVCIPATAYVTFWSCASYTDTTPSGQISFLDCHDNALDRLDVRALTGLKFLDCSCNHLAELPLDGLTEIQALIADNNRLTNLEVRHLKHLRVLKCANNRLEQIDVSGLTCLKIFDYSGNPLSSFKAQSAYP